MIDQYPVQAYLHRFKQTASAECPFCSEARDTLTRFACVCPRFREGCTAAHSQKSRVILDVSWMREQMSRSHWATARQPRRSALSQKYGSFWLKVQPHVHALAAPAPRSCRMRTTQNRGGALNTSNSVFNADDPGRACNQKRRRRSDDDIDDAKTMEADGEDNAKAGLMANRPGGG